MHNIHNMNIDQLNGNTNEGIMTSIQTIERTPKYRGRREISKHKSGKSKTNYMLLQQTKEVLKVSTDMTYQSAIGCGLLRYKKSTDEKILMFPS